MAGEFPYYRVSAAAPRERGLQYGRQARDRIAVSLSIYARAFEQQQISWSEVERRARAFMTTIAGYDQTLLDEMGGIATGADVSIERIVALNARTELLYGGSKPPSGEEERGEGCTACLALPSITADGELIHGQNWDWLAECADSAAVVRIDHGNGNPMLAFMEAGMLARMGFNAAGIALTGNFLTSDRDRGRNGIPIPLLRRRILQSTDLASAIGEVYRTPRAFSNNMMISHAAGVAVNLEASPDEVFWLKPQDGLMVHSNHFKSPVAQVKLRDIGLETSPDSLYRDERVHDLLAPRRGQLQVSDFQSAFRDDFGLPRAVCRTPAPGSSGADLATVATVIMKPKQGRMWIVRQPYAGGDLVEYRLNEE